MDSTRCPSCRGSEKCLCSGTVERTKRPGRGLCKRLTCFRKAVQDGRCAAHQLEVERKRKGTNPALRVDPYDSPSSHEDPLIQKIFACRNRAADPMAEHLRGRVLSEEEAAESFQKAKEADRVVSVTADVPQDSRSFRAGLMAAESVISHALDGCFCDDGRGEPECLGCRRLREVLVKLGRVSLSSNLNDMRTGRDPVAGPLTAELRNLVESVARRLFSERKFEEEMAVRGLLVRTERLEEAERRLAEADDSRRRADLVHESNFRRLRDSMQGWVKRALEAEKKVDSVLVALGLKADGGTQEDGEAEDV